jgi:hypothetical protein
MAKKGDRLALGLLINLGLSLMPAAARAEATLSLERTDDSFANGVPIWLLKLSDGKKLLGSWQAASGARERQKLGRLWKIRPARARMAA